MKKIIISLAIIGIVAGISLGVTGAWWNSAAVSHNASFTSGTLQLKLANSWNDNALQYPTITDTWDQGNMEPGGTPLDKTLYMKNVGSIDAHRMSFAVTRISGNGGSGMAQRMRITKLDYGAYEGNGNWGNQSLLTGGAGADLSNYVAPTYCDVTVDPSGAYKTIHAGVAAATTDGDVVCVKPGNYQVGWQDTAFPITIDKSITLVSLEGPDTTTITAPADKNAINIAANNVTIKGFTITGAAYGIDTGGHTGINITDNKIVNYSKEGIWIDGGSANISNNVIQASEMPNSSYSEDSIYIKGAATVTVTHNDLGNNKYAGQTHKPANCPSGWDWSTAVGLSLHDDCNVTATYNAIHNNDFGVVVKNANADVTVNYNDISGNTSDSESRDFFFEAPGNGCPSAPFNFKNNWWGDFSPADHVVGNLAGCANGMSDVINYTPYAGGPFIGFINGADPDNNGFADLYDFYYLYTHQAQGINVNYGLNHGQWGRLEMAVQLDGPTTGNDYQGKTLGMDMTVNMYQH